MDWITLVGIIIFIVLDIIAYIFFKNIWNPVVLFCGLYTLIFILYSLHLFNLNYASDSTMILVIVGTLSFFLGSMLSIGINWRFYAPKVVRISSFDGICSVNYKVLIAFNLFAFAFLFYFAVQVITMLNSGKTMWYIRHIMFTEDMDVGIISSTLMNFLYSYFVWPWTYVIIPMSVALFLITKKRTKQINIFLITTIINISLFVLITAGRISFIYYLMYFIVISLILGKKYKLSFRMKMTVITIAVFGIISIYIISKSRKSNALYFNAYVYICGCIPYLSYKLENFSKGVKIFTYGLSSFRGVFTFPKILIYKITGYEPWIWEIVTKNCYTQDFVYITPTNKFNAFVTPFYYFYLDGGWIGVIVLSLLFGFISMHTYAKFIKNSTVKNMMIYLLIVMGLLFSMTRFQFTSAAYFIAFIYMTLCFSEKIHFTFGNIGRKYNIRKE